MEKVPKIRELPPKERLPYIWDYYKWWIIIGVIAVIVVGNIVYGQLTKKTEVLYVLAVNADSMEFDPEEFDLFGDFLTEQGFDPKKDEVALNTGIYYTDGASMSDVYGMQAMTTILGSGSADVCLMDEALYEKEAELGAFLPVAVYLTEDELDRFSDRLIWVKIEDDDDAETETAEESVDSGELVACGILLSNENPFRESGLYDVFDPVIGIATSSSRPELAATMIRYLLREN